MFGPFEPNDLSELLKSITETDSPQGLAGLLDQIRRRKEDTHMMEHEAHNLRIRNFIEALSDGQLEDLGFLVHTINEDRDFGYVMKGLLVAEYWRRNPIDGSA